MTTTHWIIEARWWTGNPITVQCSSYLEARSRLRALMGNLAIKSAKLVKETRTRTVVLERKKRKYGR